MTSPFTARELEYLTGQRLGRLATVDAHGAPQNNPVGFVVDATTGAIDIGGWRMGASRKFRNVARNPWVALVVDDIVSVDPWAVRGIEIRGEAQALDDAEPPMPFMSRQVIRLVARRVIAWGLDPDDAATAARDV